MRARSAIVFCLAFVAPLLSAQVSRSPTNSPDEVLDQLYRMINDGSLLRPDGWKKAAQLFEHESPGPRDATILVTTKHPLAAGPPSVQGDRAEAEEKWVDDLGTVGPDLSYKPPPRTAVEAEGNIFIWHLIRVDRTAKDRKSQEQVVGQPDWRIEGALTLRWVSREAAIRYLQEQREKTNDSHIRENADRTIAILKGLPAPRNHI